MRSIKLIFLLTLFALQAQAQCLENPTFETTITQSSQASDPFTNGRVPHWETGSISPSIFSYATNPHAWMWSKNDNHESIVADYPFEAGKTYTVTFDIKTDDGDGNPAVFDYNIDNKASVNIYAIDKTSSHDTPSPTTTWADPIFIYRKGWGPNKLYSDFSGPNWHTMTVTFTAPTNRDAVMIFPYMGRYSGIGQAILMVDNVTIIGEPDNDFHFQTHAATNAPIATSFEEVCDVWLDGTACTHEDRYHLDIRRIHSSGAGGYQWLGSLGWTEGEVGIINLTSLCAQNNIYFEAGYTYEVKLATQNMPCMPWNEQWRAFAVTSTIGLVNTFKLTNHWSTVEQTSFFEKNCSRIILNATGSQNYTAYHIDLLRRPVGTVNWTLVSSLGWTIGQITAPIDLVQRGLFVGNQPQMGYEYGVKFALQNTSSGAHTCLGWIEEIKTFTVEYCGGASKTTGDSRTNTISQLTPKGFEVAPNPSKGQFRIQLHGIAEGTVRVVSLDGRIVAEQTITHQKELAISLKNYEAGIYVIQIISEEEVLTKKIVLQ